MRALARFILSLALLVAIAVPLAAQPRSTPAPAIPGMAPAQIEAIERVVREYILRNPEIILEAVEALEQKRQAETEGKQRNAIAARRDDIINDPDSPVSGNPKGDVTVVEFFDYRCPYCKQVAPHITQLVKEDSKLRIVYKELPILGPDSIVAARAALAARGQGKYHELHKALMNARGTLDETVVLKIAADVGVDATRLKADMQLPAIDQALRRNLDLARAIDINGTPAFIVGSLLVPGAVDLDTLKRLIAAERSTK
ncbi:MAG: DsbA family protein [Rhodospirillales bacterium]|nr:DsbA family protein [Rhodospirillales bacterium]